MNKTYTELAQRTTATESNLEVIKERITLEDLFNIMSFFVSISQNGSNLDILKKKIFYGRIPEDSEPPFMYEATRKLCLEARGRLNLKTIKLLHGIIGISTELGEMIDCFLDHLRDGKPLDEVNIDEEGGDLCWYIPEIATAIGKTMEQFQSKNIAKLKARYPDVFCEKKADNRDLVNERAILEGKTHADKIRDMHGIQSQPGNYDYSEYMYGMYISLELALAVVEEREPKFLEYPEEWLCNKPSSQKPKPLLAENTPIPS